ncbi:hypothetical protein EVAR_17061_1 [Eumeta japonica]|uniref:Uncharacterized protein n=1 Tax=Eumeta variegata TaxID=151549 RepID=A0A4C1V6S9_EUMVA|nr:hypothetical protein EVAR_17061_1 [Eumeta japonica]
MAATKLERIKVAARSARLGVEQRDRTPTHHDYHISRECDKLPATMPSRSRPTPTGTNAGRPACVCAAEHARRAPRYAPRPRPACYFAARHRGYPGRAERAGTAAPALPEVSDAPRAYHAADGGAPTRTSWEQLL